MLILALIIGACIRFHNFARDNGLSKWLWAFMPLIGYLASVVLAVVILFLIDPSLIDNTGAVLIGEVLSAATGIGVPYLLMTAAAKRAESTIEDGDILDNDL